MVALFVSISVAFVLIVAIVFVVLKNKHFKQAILDSKRIETVRAINKECSFIVFDNKLNYCVHFKDLEEYKLSDIKLIKYSFLVKNKTKIIDTLSNLNQNIDSFNRYKDEINKAMLINEDEIITKYRVNKSKFAEKEHLIINGMIKKPILSCSFDIFFDYVSPQGRNRKESEHFLLKVSDKVDVDSFISKTFPEVKIEDYGFKPHYLNPSQYLYNSLLIPNGDPPPKDYLYRTKEQKEEYIRCYNFYKGKEVFYCEVLRLAMDTYKSTRKNIASLADANNIDYEIIDINPYEFFVVLDNTSYIYVGHYAGEEPISEYSSGLGTNVHTFIVELNYNPFADAMPYESMGAYSCSYYRYLTFSSYKAPRYVISRAKSLLSNVDIDEINETWEGIPAACVVYEANCQSEYGYALMLTESVDKCVSIGNSNYNKLFEYEVNRMIKDEEIYFGGYDDMMTYGLSVDKAFIPLLHKIKKQVRLNLTKDLSYEDELYKNIKYYVIPINIKDKDRNYISNLKVKLFERINHKYLLQFDSYDHVNGHQKWKNEYLLYQLCNKIYGNQVIYQFRPSFLKTDKGQLSYDIYLSKYKIAIEYQGKQHFEPIDFFGGEEAFKDLQRRDNLKKQLSVQNDVSLIEITYKDLITSELIKERVESVIKKK